MKKFVGIVGIGLSALLLSGCGGPSDSDVKNIALGYGLPGLQGLKPEQIDIVKSYEKDGKTVVIFKTDALLCEMPMLEIDGKWGATGIECKLMMNNADSNKNAITTSNQQHPLDTPPQADLLPLAEDTFTATENFTLALKGKDNRMHYAKYEVVVRFETPEMGSEYEAKRALLKDKMIGIFANQFYDELSSSQLKNMALKIKIAEEVNQRLLNDRITTVYFTKIEFME